MLSFAVDDAIFCIARKLVKCLASMRDKVFYKVLLISLVLFLLSSCARETPTPTELPAPQVSVSQDNEKSTALPTDEQGSESTEPAQRQNELPEPPENRTQYKLDLILDYYSKYGTVSETITYTNRTGKTLDEILLLVAPRDFPDAFSLQSLTGERVSGHRDEGTRIWVKLDQPLQNLEKATINILYRLKFPAVEGIFGGTNRQLNIADWYPLIPPYDPETGWIAYNRVTDQNNIIVGEYLVQEIADFNVSLKLINQPEFIEVAASAPATKLDDIYYYELPLARAFAFSVSDSYFEHEIVYNGTRIHTYLFMNHQDYGPELCEIARKSLELFEELFYPYPREMISIVAGDFLHNMEMDGMFMLSHKVIDNYRSGEKNNMTILTPHELSHQWFYSLVGNDTVKEPWLDEAFATYMEILYYERYHPETVDWWWRNRVYEYDHSGYVNSDIHIEGGYEKYRAAVYLNGARFLADLRNTVGDEAFFAALKDYVYENTWQIANREDFFKAIARHSNTNLSGLFHQYFRD